MPPDFVGSETSRQPAVRSNEQIGVSDQFNKLLGATLTRFTHALH